MCGLKERYFVADICARRDTYAANLSRNAVAEVVAIQVSCCNHVELSGTQQYFLKDYVGDGVLQQVFGFNNEGNSTAGAPWEILPQPGDAFTILGKWMDLDDQGNVSQVAYQESQTLIFGSQPFQW